MRLIKHKRPSVRVDIITVDGPNVSLQRVKRFTELDRLAIR